MSDVLFGGATLTQPYFNQLSVQVDYKEVVALQIEVTGLKAKMEYMGTKADIQELRADFNKSMRELQEYNASQFRSILFTLWGLLFTAIVSIVVGIVSMIPWDKILG